MSTVNINAKNAKKGSGTFANAKKGSGTFANFCESGMAAQVAESSGDNPCCMKSIRFMKNSMTSKSSSRR